MDNDRSSIHSLAILNQKGTPIPPWLTQAIKKSKGDLVIFPSESYLSYKAKWLRELAKKGADLVVLHHGPFDVVPTVAFATDECPPVVLINIADHQFWLGSSVSDIVISLRTAGAEHAASRRFISFNTVLPIPLKDALSRISRNNARLALGIPDDQIALLSVGRAEKYHPCGKYDFVATTNKILDRHPSAHLYIVGESLKGIAPHLRCNVNERLHFVGSIDDPFLYRAAADVYLESFPFGSQTALLEAALNGLPVVSAYAPLFALLVANDDAIKDLIPNPDSEQEYIEQVESLICQPKRRSELGNMLRRRLLLEHVGNGWLDRLAAVYKKTDCLTHSPRPIQTSQCCISNDDISLSMWHTTSKSDSPAILEHTAYINKYIGNYRKALQIAWLNLCDNPIRLASWRIFMLALLGRFIRFIKWLHY